VDNGIPSIERIIIPLPSPDQWVAFWLAANIQIAFFVFSECYRFKKMDRNKL